MDIWAIANQKGGVSKTTTVITLGSLLAKRSYRTLLLDMDPHGSMSTYFRLDPDNTERSLYRLFQIKKAKIEVSPHEMIHHTSYKNLDLLPASTAMATLDRQLGASGGMGLVVSHALKMLTDEYDYVLIDCPPLLGVLMINALAACEHLIIPVQTESLAVRGLERMLTTLSMIKRTGYPVSDYTILPTMYDQRTRASRNTLMHMQTHYDEKLSRTVIPIDTQFREASAINIPLPYMAPNTHGAIAYNELMEELLLLRSSQPLSVKAAY